MNMNPWFLERMVDYERDRIQHDMRQIRLEKEAMRANRIEEKTNNKASFHHPSLFMSIVSTLVRLRLLQLYTWKSLRYRGSTQSCHR